MWKLTVPFLLRSVRRHRWATVVVLLAGFAAGVLATAKSLIESALISSVAAVDADTSGSRWPDRVSVDIGPTAEWVSRLTATLFEGRSFVTVVIGYLLISVVGGLISVGAAAARSLITRKMFTDLHADVVGKSLRAPTAVSEEGGPGGLAGALQTGAGAVAGSYAFLVEVTQYVATLLIAVVVLMQVDMIIGLCAIGLAVLLTVTSVIQARHLHDTRESYDHRRRRLAEVTGDVLNNRDLLVANERTDTYRARTAAIAHQMGTLDRRLAIWERGYQRIGMIAQDAGLIIILAVLLIAVSRATGEAGSAGQAYFFAAVFVRLMTPLQALLTGYDAVMRSMSQSRTFMRFLRRTEVMPVLSDGDRTEQARGEIMAAGVRFGYRAGEPVLDGCSFTVPAGGVTLLVGRSGAGKTTIARLLLGFLRPEQGRITLDGRTVEKWGSTALLRQISYLSQIGHVVGGSVRENLFADDAAEEAMLDALQRAGLGDRGRETTLLDSSSTGLSEGQKQRVALARLLLDDAAIAVLDEPLAGVDSFTVADVRLHLADWMSDPDRTVVVVSHRLAFLSVATHVLVLGEQGAIVEAGDPQVLAADPDSQLAALLAATSSLAAVGQTLVTTSSKSSRGARGR